MANDFVMRLLARIRTLREAQCLSQEAFAELAGLKYKHYQAIEAGRKPKFQIPTLVKIAEALRLKPWELINLDAELVVVAEEQAADEPGPAPAKAARQTLKPKRASKRVERRS